MTTVIARQTVVTPRCWMLVRYLGNHKEAVEVRQSDTFTVLEVRIDKMGCRFFKLKDEFGRELVGWYPVGRFYITERNT